MESNLHWDVIHEILLRLPVKSLVRFKCVCKLWHSLISDSHFAKSHYELSAAPTHHKLLQITCSGSEARSIDLDASLDDDSFVARLIPPLPKPGKYAPNVLILGSCRGFVLIQRFPSLYIWNPSTGFHRDLSSSDICLLEHHYAENLLIGFGYDPSTDDYLVVELWPKYYTTFDDDDDNMVTRLVLYSLRTNSWKEIQDSHLSYYYSHNQSLFFNDAIHWLAYGENEVDKVILAFDMVEKNFCEISLPDGDFTIGFDFCNLGTMGGCLCLYLSEDSKTQLWIMKEYKVESSWIMHEIPWYLSLECMSKGGELVALCSGELVALCPDVAELVKLNEKEELLECCEYCCGGLCGFETILYTESLLSLPRDSDGRMETPSTEIDQKK